jgi:polygalacturonase
VGAHPRPDTTDTCNVTDYGAGADGRTLNTGAIQAAIDACAAKGGGVVTFGPGAYLTGSIFVKTGVTLRIDKGVEILGSQDLADYPDIDTRVAGIEMRWPAALINVCDQDNAAIVGEGLINARGKPFWDRYWTMRRAEYEPKGLRWIVDYDCKRPRTLLVSNSSNVTVQGITLQQAGFWPGHILYSRHVTIDGVVIRNNVDGHGPSTDGIDIDSSSFVLVENCDIDCNDDNFCLKAAGCRWVRVNRPPNTLSFATAFRARAGPDHLRQRDLRRHPTCSGPPPYSQGTGVGLRFKSAQTRGGRSRTSISKILR